MKKGDECDKEKRVLGNNVVCIENVLIVYGAIDTILNSKLSERFFNFFIYTS